MEKKMEATIVGYILGICRGLVEKKMETTIL